MNDSPPTAASSSFERISGSDAGKTTSTISVRLLDYHADGRPPSALTFPAVHFSMRWVAWHVWLVVGDESGSARQIHQMESAQESGWHLTVRLRPGTYRYRYYAQHGAATIHVRPDEAEELPLRMDGLDALLTVSA